MLFCRKRTHVRPNGPGFILACLASIATPLGCAQAGSASTTFNVTLTVTKQCTVTAPTTINFGSLGAASLLSGTQQQSQSFSVMCSQGTPYTIGFSSPNDLAVGSTTHQMKGAVAANTSLVQYQLTDLTAGSTNALPLGGTGSVITAIGTGAAQTKTLQATLLAPGNALTPDTYTDTVTMTVNY